jgi:hypothetical protein
MLSRRQVASLIEKARYINILDVFMQKENFYQKIPEANKMF